MNLKKTRSLIYFGLSGLLFTSCHLSDQKGKEKQAQTAKGYSLALPPAETHSLQPEKNGTLSLKKIALKKAFSLATSIQVSDNLPSPFFTLPKIVYFDVVGQKLGLFEFNLYQVYDVIQAPRLIQTFEVVASTDESFLFDWKMGLEVISLRPDLTVSDAPASVHSVVTGEEVTFSPISSFVKKMHFVEDELKIEQVSRVRAGEVRIDPASFFTGSLPVVQSDFTLTVFSSLSPYQPNPHFEPKMNQNDHGFGYFELPRKRKGERTLDSLSTRWDTSQSIVVGLSKYIPNHLISPIREGILYWNRVLGKEFIRIETQVEPEIMPTQRKVMIHWLHDKQAPMLWSSLQSDPLTGEIRSGNIFLGSVLLKGLQGLDVNGAQTQIPGFKNRESQAVPFRSDIFRLCSYKPTSSAPIAQQLLETYSQTKSDTQDVGLRLEEIIYDQVRYISAHEMGHILGLRHQFASNLAMDLEGPEHIKEWQNYLESNSHPGLRTHSSIMDYPNPRDRGLLGRWIKDHTLDLDERLISWGYSDQDRSTENLKMPPYCYDEQGWNFEFFGCGIHTSGKNPFTGYAYDLFLARESLAQTVLGQVVEHIRSSHPADRKTVRGAFASVHPEIEALTHSFPVLLAEIPLVGSGKSLEVDWKLGGLNWFNENIYQKETRAHLKEKIQEVGGLPGLLQFAYPLDFQKEGEPILKGWLLPNLEKKLATSSFLSGKTQDGKAYSLSRQEVEEMRQLLPLFAKKFENRYLATLLSWVTLTMPTFGIKDAENLFQVTQSYVNDPKFGFSSDVIDESWEGQFGAIAAQILLEPETRLKAVLNQREIDYPKANFSFEARLLAVRFFSKKIFRKEGWLVPLRLKLIDVFNERLKVIAQVIQPEAQSIEPSIVGSLDTSQEFKTWLTQEAMILKALKEIDGTQTQPTSSSGAANQPAQASTSGLDSSQVLNQTFGASWLRWFQSFQF